MNIRTDPTPPGLARVLAICEQNAREADQARRILEYSAADLIFAFWLKRLREELRHGKAIPNYIDAELNRWRPLRNPNLTVFILD